MELNGIYCINLPFWMNIFIVFEMHLWMGSEFPLYLYLVATTTLVKTMVMSGYVGEPKDQTEECMFTLKHYVCYVLFTSVLLLDADVKSDNSSFI